MTGSVTGGRRNARRSTRVSRQLAQARERNNRQLVEIRERELQIDTALRDYVAVTEQIEAADHSCQDRVDQLERRITQLRQERDTAVANVRATQAKAALTIHAAGRTVRQVAELLQLSEKTARQLIGRGRALPSTPRQRQIGQNSRAQDATRLGTRLEDDRWPSGQGDGRYESEGHAGSDTVPALTAQVEDRDSSLPNAGA
jgi:hypothetical protein